MKKTVAILGMLVATNVFAYQDEPFKPFDATRNVTNKTTITWLQVDNVNKTCDAEAFKRQGRGIGYAVQACAFWDFKGTTSTCTIVTPKTTNLTVLGHEARHCFQGEFHAGE